MAKSTKTKLRGIFNWAKVFEDNRDMEGFEGAYEECDGAYTVDFGMDEEEYDKFKATGSAKKAKEKDGLYWVKLVRKHKHPSIPEFGGAPGVYTSQGTPWDFDVDGYINNGSEGTVLITTYKAGRVIGSRLEKIQVLVKAEGNGDDFLERPSVPRVVDEETPAPKKTTKKAPVETPVEEDLDDEIPF